MGQGAYPRSETQFERSANERRQAGRHPPMGASPSKFPPSRRSASSAISSTRRSPMRAPNISACRRSSPGRRASLSPRSSISSSTGRSPSATRARRSSAPSFAIAASPRVGLAVNYAVYSACVVLGAPRRDRRHAGDPAAVRRRRQRRGDGSDLHRLSVLRLSAVGIADCLAQSLRKRAMIASKRCGGSA